MLLKMLDIIVAFLSNTISGLTIIFIQVVKSMKQLKNANIQGVFSSILSCANCSLEMYDKHEILHSTSFTLEHWMYLNSRLEMLQRVLSSWSIYFWYLTKWRKEKNRKKEKIIAKIKPTPRTTMSLYGRLNAKQQKQSPFFIGNLFDVTKTEVGIHKADCEEESHCGDQESMNFYWTFWFFPGCFLFSIPATTHIMRQSLCVWIAVLWQW